LKGGESVVFEKLDRRYIFEGYIEAVTPLHIGSGRPEIEREERGIDLPVIRNVDGTPYIPGSSIKGKVRAEAERIARSMGEEVCNPPDVKNMCGSLKDSEDKLCVVCKIFGTAGEKISRASKVKFRDALPLKPVRAEEVRTGIALDRETGTVYRGALYTMEAVPAGTRFRLEMVADNLTEDELRLLMAALRSVEDTALGGQSTRGLGKVRICIERVRVRTAGYYLGKEPERVIEGEELERFLGRA